MELNQLKGDRVHSRQIQVNTYACNQGGIIVEGELIDHRLMQYYILTGEKRPPGIIHHMVIRMWVDGQLPQIKDIEVEMPGVPRTECRETMECVKQIVGWSIVSGFTNKIKKTLHGSSGCSHLSSLVLAMAPAAIQGFWAQMARTKVEKDVSVAAFKTFVLNSCYVWREDGELARDICQKLGSD